MGTSTPGTEGPGGHTQANLNNYQSEGSTSTISDIQMPPRTRAQTTALTSSPHKPKAMGQTLGPLSEGEAAHAPTARDDDDTLSEREDTQTQGYTPFGTLAVGKVGESSAGGVAKKGSSGKVPKPKLKTRSGVSLLKAPPVPKTNSVYKILPPAGAPKTPPVKKRKTTKKIPPKPAADPPTGTPNSSSTVWRAVDTPLQINKQQHLKLPPLGEFIAANRHHDFGNQEYLRLPPLGEFIAANPRHHDLDLDNQHHHRLPTLGELMAGNPRPLGNQQNIRLPPFSEFIAAANPPHLGNQHHHRLPPFSEFIAAFPPDPLEQPIPTSPQATSGNPMSGRHGFAQTFRFARPRPYSIQLPHPRPSKLASGTGRFYVSEGPPRAWKEGVGLLYEDVEVVKLHVECPRWKPY